MDSANQAIISIKPTYSNAILEGSKTVELRRKIPPLEIGTRLWIYSTKPVASIVGLATVSAIVQDDPEKLWLQFSEKMGVCKQTFQDYFYGTNAAFAIHLENVSQIEPVPIEVLRTLFEGFHPPQVLARLTEERYKALIKHLQNRC